jgi:hypothetical protein
MTLVVVRRVASLEEAFVIAGALRSAGIAAEVFDMLGQSWWKLQTALGGFRVVMPASQFMDARDSLGAPTSPSDDAEPIRPSIARRAHKVVAATLVSLFG